MFPSHLYCALYNAFAEGDDNVLKRNKELIFKPVADVPTTKAAAQPGGNKAQQSIHMVSHMMTRSKNGLRMTNLCFYDIAQKVNWRSAY